MPIAQDDVIAYLKACRGSELSDVLAEVFPSRPEAWPEGNAFEYRLVLAVASRENVSETDRQEWGPWRTAAVAPRNPRHYPAEFEGEPFCQYGHCNRCGIEICSHVKNALCPICGDEADLT